MAKYTSDVKQDRAYSSPEDAFSYNRVNPEWARQSKSTLLDLTNIATNTTGYAYISLDGYRYATLQGETSGTAPTDILTVTVEGTTQTGSDPSTLTYQDVTSTLFGTASWVDTDFMAIADTPLTFTYLRVKYVTSNDSGADCDLKVDVKLSW